MPRPIRESPKKGGRLIRDHRRIAWAYLTGFFLIDIISIIPFGSAFRLARLLKLTRLLKGNKVLTKWSSRLSLVSSSLVSLASLA